MVCPGIVFKCGHCGEGILPCENPDTHICKKSPTLDGRVERLVSRDEFEKEIETFFPDIWRGRETSWAYTYYWMWRSWQSCWKLRDKAERSSG